MTSILSFRCTQKIEHRIRKIATREDRTVSKVIERLVLKALKK